MIRADEPNTSRRPQRDGAWMDHARSEATSPASYLEIVFLHRRTILLCLVASVMLGWVAVLVWPRAYESQAKLMVKVGRESVAIDPTVTTSQTLMLQKTQEEEIISALEVIGSRQVAEQVVKKLEPSPILNGSLPSEGERQPTWVEQTRDTIKGGISSVVDFCLVNAGVRDNISDFELAVRQVQSTVEIEAPKKSNVITVTAVSKTPEMAQALAQAITDAFRAEHRTVTHTPGSTNFFQNQSDELEAKLVELSEAKKQFMQENKLVSIEANRLLLTEQLRSIDSELLLARGSLEQANAEITDLQTKIGATDSEIVSTKQGSQDSTWSGMRQSVYELELMEEDLAAKFSDKHPDLVRTRDQLEGARKILERLESERVDKSTTMNPAKLRMEEDLQRAQTKVVGLLSMIEEKQSQRSQIDGEVNELLRLELDLDQMDRDISLTSAGLHKLRESHEEARVLDELNGEQITNISVFQPATFMERAISPQKKLLAAGSVMFGLLMGVGLAFLKESNNHKLRTTSQVTTRLQQPVVSNIPQLRGFKSFDSKRHRKLLSDKATSIISDLLMTNSNGRHDESKAKTIGVLSCDAGCGASTLSAALAIAATNDVGLKTILIDADARKRSVSNTLGSNGAPGLAELVDGEATESDCIQRLDRFGVNLISSAAPDSDKRANPQGVLGAIEQLQDSHDLVIVDLPPASQPDQAVSLAQYLDHVIVMIESDSTDVTTASRLLHRLNASDADVSIVLNKSHDPLPRWVRTYITG